MDNSIDMILDSIPLKKNDIRYDFVYVIQKIQCIHFRKKKKLLVYEMINSTTY